MMYSKKDKEDDLFLSDIGSLSQIYDESELYGKSNKRRPAGKNSPPHREHDRVTESRNSSSALAKGRNPDKVGSKVRFENEPTFRKSGARESRSEDSDMASRNANEEKSFDEAEASLTSRHNDERLYEQTPRRQYEQTPSHRYASYDQYEPEVNDDDLNSDGESDPPQGRLFSNTSSDSYMLQAAVAAAAVADMGDLPWHKLKTSATNYDFEDRPAVGDSGAARNSVTGLQQKQQLRQREIRSSNELADDFSIERASFGKWYEKEEQKRVSERKAERAAGDAAKSGSNELLDENYPNVSPYDMVNMLKGKQMKLSLESREERSRNGSMFAFKKCSFDDDLEETTRTTVPKTPGRPRLDDDDDDVIIMDDTSARNPDYSSAASQSKMRSSRFSSADDPTVPVARSTVPSTLAAQQQIPTRYRVELDSGGTTPSSNLNAGTNSSAGTRTQVISSANLDASSQFMASRLSSQQPNQQMVQQVSASDAAFRRPPVSQLAPSGFANNSYNTASSGGYTPYGPPTASNNMQSVNFYANYPPPSAVGYSNFPGQHQHQQQQNWTPMNPPNPAPVYGTSVDGMPPRAEGQMSRPTSNEVKEEIRQQNKNLMAQRDQYFQKYNLLQEELNKLKNQKKELSEAKKSEQKETFLKENDRLQVEIQSKIKAVLNVIDMLSKIIKVDESTKTETHFDEASTRNSASDRDDVKETTPQSSSGAKERKSRRSRSRSRHRSRSRSRHRSKSRPRPRSRSRYRRSRSPSPGRSRRRRSRSRSSSTSRTHSRRKSLSTSPKRSRRRSRSRSHSRDRGRRGVSRHRSRERNHERERSRDRNDRNQLKDGDKAAAAATVVAAAAAVSTTTMLPNKPVAAGVNAEVKLVAQEGKVLAVGPLPLNSNALVVGAKEAPPPKRFYAEKFKPFSSDNNPLAAVEVGRQRAAIEEKSRKCVNYVYYDPEIHWCHVCNVFPATAKEYLMHLHDAEHKNTLASRNKIEYPWHNTQTAEPPKVSHPEWPTERVPIRGLPFFVSAAAWYCKLCCQWMGDLHCASVHLKSDLHESKYKEYTTVHPDWEEKWVQSRAQSREEQILEMRSLGPNAAAAAAAVFTCAPPPQLPSPQLPPFDATAKLKFPIKKRTVSTSSSSSSTSSSSSSSSSSDGKSRSKKSKKSKKKKERKRRKEEKLQQKVTTTTTVAMTSLPPVVTVTTTPTTAWTGTNTLRETTASVPPPLWKSIALHSNVRNLPQPPKPRVEPSTEKVDRTGDDKFVDEWMDAIRQPHNEKELMELKNKLKKKEPEVKSSNISGSRRSPGESRGSRRSPAESRSSRRSPAESRSRRSPGESRSSRRSPVESRSSRRSPVDTRSRRRSPIESRNSRRSPESRSSRKSPAESWRADSSSSRHQGGLESSSSTLASSSVSTSLRSKMGPSRFDDTLPKKILDKPIIIGKGKLPFIGKMPSKSAKKGSETEYKKGQSANANSSNKSSEDSLTSTIRKQLAELEGGQEQDSCNMVVDMDINDDDDEVTVVPVVDESSRRKDFEEALKILYPEDGKKVEDIPLPVPSSQIQNMVQPMMQAIMQPITQGGKSQFSNVSQDYLVSLIESTLVEKLKAKLPDYDVGGPEARAQIAAQLASTIQQTLRASGSNVVPNTSKISDAPNVSKTSNKRNVAGGSNASKIAETPIPDDAPPGTFDVAVESPSTPPPPGTTPFDGDIPSSEPNSGDAVKSDHRSRDSEKSTSTSAKKKNPISQKKRQNLRKVREKLEEQEKQLQAKIEETRKNLAAETQPSNTTTVSPSQPITDMDSDLMLLGIEEADSAALQF